MSSLSLVSRSNGPLGNERCLEPLRVPSGVASTFALMLLLGSTACSLKDYGYLGAELGRGSAGGTSTGGMGNEGGSPDFGESAGAGRSGSKGEGGQAGHVGNGAEAGSQSAGGIGGSATGATGAGGAPVCPEAVGSGDDGLIDDFEDGNLAIVAADGRAGRVVVSSDRTAELTARAEKPGRSGSRALHVSSDTNLTRSGGVVEFRLLETTRQCRYDAHKYAGLQLSVRGNLSFTLGLQTYDTVPIDIGGCTASCDAASAGEFTATEDWTDLKLPFDQFVQSGALGEFTADTAQLMRIELAFSRTTDPVELWIDDVAFY